MEQRVFLIDTDTASDDAVALILALRTAGVRVAAITTVAGNVPVEQATRNALYTVELCTAASGGAAAVPVFAGASRPLRRPYESATWFHGEDGLGDQGYAAPRLEAEPAHAVDALIEVIRANPGLTLVTLGPLTNIALALAKAPAIARLVGRCVVMGGAPCCEGNVTPAAEYNIWVDPDAARVVFHSGMPIDLIGWHLCRGAAILDDADVATVLGFGTPVARFAIECNSTAREAIRRQTGESGISLPDPVAMAIALEPSLVTSCSRHLVDVETESDLTRGMTVIDRLNVGTDARNRAVWSRAIEANAQASVAWQMDVPGFKRLLFDALH